MHKKESEGSKDVDGCTLPTLVYMAREKRPHYHTNFKAGAINALVLSIITTLHFLKQNLYGESRIQLLITLRLILLISQKQNFQILVELNYHILFI